MSPLTALIALAFVRLVAPPPLAPTCFAYLKGGDLWAQCGGPAQRITDHAKLAEFALSNGNLAVSDGQPKSRIAIYSLPNRRLLKSIPIDSNASPGLKYSCGQIIADFSESPFNWSVEPAGTSATILRCMASQAESQTPDLDQTSPNGRFLAYSATIRGGPMILCLADMGYAAKGWWCASAGLRLFEYSVADDGRVLSADNWDRLDCDADADRGQIDPIRRGPHQSFNNPCTALYIYSWPDHHRTGPLVKFASNPQWITPGQAELLTAAAPFLRSIHFPPAKAN